MEYIKDGSTLPVPFNIIPTFKSFYLIFKKLKRFVIKKKKESIDEIPVRERRSGLNAMSKQNGQVRFFY